MSNVLFDVVFVMAWLGAVAMGALMIFRPALSVKILYRKGSLIGERKLEEFRQDPRAVSWRVVGAILVIVSTFVLFSVARAWTH